jgi:hypothetical protein
VAGPDSGGDRTDEGEMDSGVKTTEGEKKKEEKHKYLHLCNSPSVDRNYPVINYDMQACRHADMQR